MSEALGEPSDELKESFRTTIRHCLGEAALGNTTLSTWTDSEQLVGVVVTEKIGAVVGKEQCIHTEYMLDSDGELTKTVDSELVSPAEPSMAAKLEQANASALSSATGMSEAEARIRVVMQRLQGRSDTELAARLLDAVAIAGEEEDAGMRQVSATELQDVIDHIRGAFKAMPQ